MDKLKIDKRNFARKNTLKTICRTNDAIATNVCMLNNYKCKLQ